MSDEFVKMSTRLPKELHAKLKSQADAEGTSLTDVVIARLQAAVDGDVSEASAEYLAVLNDTRTSPLFGEETILQEMLRRLVSIQMMSVKGLIDRMSTEDAKALLKGLDEQARMVLEQRFGPSQT